MQQNQVSKQNDGARLTQLSMRVNAIVESASIMQELILHLKQLNVQNIGLTNELKEKQNELTQLVGELGYVVPGAAGKSGPRFTSASSTVNVTRLTQAVVQA